MKHVFIFGRDPELSLLEIESYLNARKIGHKILSSSNIAAVMEIGETDLSQTIREIGGTVKIAREMEEGEWFYAGTKSKIRYGISSYGDDDAESIEALIKKEMKEGRIKAYKKCSGRKLPFLSPSEIISSKLLEEGFEIVLYKGIIAKTIACFNPKEVESRDNKRPFQRHEQMISIRLAKILINLSGATAGKTIVDPFCGYGILLQEAMLNGINSIGVDVDANCVNAAMKNLEWTKKQFSRQEDYKVIRGNSTELSKFVPKADCAATEPHLGPLMKKLPEKSTAISVIKSLTPMYEKLMREIRKAITGKTAIIVPRFRLYNGERVVMNFNAILEAAGLKSEQILPEIPMPIIYTAPGSTIEREIWVVSAK